MPEFRDSSFRLRLNHFVKFERPFTVANRSRRSRQPRILVGARSKSNVFDASQHKRNWKSKESELCLAGLLIPLKVRNDLVSFRLRKSRRRQCLTCLHVKELYFPVASHRSVAPDLLARGVMKGAFRLAWFSRAETRHKSRVGRPPF